MNAPLYTTEILRLAASLDPPLRLDQASGRAERRSPTCGSRVRTEIRIDEEGRVTALSQEVHACAFGQAAAAIVQRASIGRSAGDVAEARHAIEQWLAGTSETPGEWDGLEALSPARSRTSRHGAILLPFRALAAALEDAR